MSNFLLYIDPGSGSYLVQMVVAAALGASMFFKNIRLYVKAFFSRFSKKGQGQLICKCQSSLHLTRLLIVIRQVLFLAGMVLFTGRSTRSFNRILINLSKAAATKG